MRLFGRLHGVCRRPRNSATTQTLLILTSNGSRLMVQITRTYWEIMLYELMVARLSLVWGVKKVKLRRGAIIEAGETA